MSNTGKTGIETLRDVREGNLRAKGINGMKLLARSYGLTVAADVNHASLLKIIMMHEENAAPFCEGCGDVTVPIVSSSVAVANYTCTNDTCDWKDFTVTVD